MVRARLEWGRLLAAWAFSFLALGSLCGQTTRPTTESLLPESTLVYIQFADVSQFIEQMKASSVGRLIADERIAPLVEGVYGAVKDEYEKVRDNMGVSLEQLQTLFTGELCFAVAGFEDRSPGVVLLFDYDPEAGTLDALVGNEWIRGNLELESGEPIQEADVSIQTWKAGDTTVYYFMHDGTFAVGTDVEMMKEMLARWRGEAVGNDRTLAQNRKFVTIMNRCRGTKETPPEARFFVDPIDLAKALTRGNLGARFVIALLPTLGLDGLLAVGGASISNDDGYESVAHLHLLLASPRSGIPEMLQLRPGDCTPEAWVPGDTISYITGNLDLDRMYTELERMVNAIQGEDSFAKGIDENINKELEIDLRADILDGLTGRATLVTWHELPWRINSQATGVGIELEDPEAFVKTLEKILEKVAPEGRVKKDEYRGVTLWQVETEDGGPSREGGVAFSSTGVRVRVGEAREQDAEESQDDELPVKVRQPTPSWTIVDRALIASDSRAFIEHAIDTFKGDGSKLAENEEFTKVSRHMTRLLGTAVPGGVLYTRPDESLRLWYEMAKSDDTRKMLERGAEENAFAAAVARTVAEHPLPDYEELRQYFAPAGAFVTSDDTGIHLLMFQLTPGDNR